MKTTNHKSNTTYQSAASAKSGSRAWSRLRAWLASIASIALMLGLGLGLGTGHTPVWAALAASPSADGDLDPTFGGDGLVTTGIGSTDSVANAVAIQPDGKIVAAGNIDGGSYQNEFFVARYNTDGSLDESFGFLGLLTIDFGSDTDIAKAVTIQPNGKIVVAGYTRVGTIYFDFAIARLNSDGSNDTTFSGDGKTTTDFAGREDFAASVAIQSDGKIVAAGHAYTSSSSADFALARYNTNGSLDTTFDGDGKVTTDFGPFTAIATGVAIQGNGKIVAAGYRYYSQSGTNFAVAQYNTNGSPDTTFDGDGKVNFYFAEGDAQAKAVDIQSDGKIVAAGYALVNSSADFALARLNTNGSLDTTFSGDGLVITDFAGFGDVARGVAIQSDGKIVAAGSASPGGPTFGDFGLARFNANGSLDATFSGDGLVTTDFAYSSDVANGVAIQSDGKIVAAGSVSVSSNYDFALARYQSGGSPTPTSTSTSMSTRTATPTAIGTSTATATATPNCTTNPNYLITVSTGATQVPATTYVPGSTCNSCTVNVTLPFAYILYDTFYTSVIASNKGNLQFTTNTATGANTCLVAPALGDSIAAYWDDLNTNINDSMGIFTSVSGAGPNRIFTIRWVAGFEANDARVDFEVRLYEGQPKYEVIYGTTRRGFSATVGVQKGDGTRSTQYECNTNGTIQSGMRLTFDTRSCSGLGAGKP